MWVDQKMLQTKKTVNVQSGRKIHTNMKNGDHKVATESTHPKFSKFIWGHLLIFASY